MIETAPLFAHEAEMAEREHEFNEQFQNGSSGPITDPRLLEEVLQRTIQLTDADDVTTEDIQHLKTVADKYRGRDLSTEPVMFELVSAMLKRVFGKALGKQADVMAQAIGQSMLDDPQARQRVERLWNRLCVTDV